MMAMEQGRQGQGAMPRGMPSGEVVIRHGYQPGLVGWVAELHGRYYAEVWGAGAPFEMQMAREFSDFMEGYDPRYDCVLSAFIGKALIGSITVYGRRLLPEGPQLRFFIVDPQWHGRGAGKALLAEALAFCRDRRFPGVFLWTVDGLPASRRMYEKAGFCITERVPDDRYTVMRDNLRMELHWDEREKTSGPSARETGACAQRGRHMNSR